jgi:hypothetical protein
MIEKINLGKFRDEYRKFKETEDYRNRKSQSRFIEIAQLTIKDLLKKGKIRNKDLTALIQMFGHSCSRENFQKHLRNLQFSPFVEDQIFSKFIEIGECGYTGRGKAAIQGLSEEQLDDVRHFLDDVLNAKSLGDIKDAYLVFREKRIPQVGGGIFSPWLYYLRPEFCPLVTGETGKFLKRLGWKGEYDEAIDLYSMLKDEFNETDLGFIDAFLWNEDRRNGILFEKRKPHENLEMDLLNNKKQIILYGPPGTGKTYRTKKIAIDLLE